jgi:hypothetical protein
VIKKLTNFKILACAILALVVAGLWPISRLEVSTPAATFDLPSITIIEATQHYAFGTLKNDPTCKATIQVNRHRWQNQAVEDLAQRQTKIDLHQRTWLIHKNLLFSVQVENGITENHQAYQRTILAELALNLESNLGLHKKIDTAGNQFWDTRLKHQLAPIIKKLGLPR